MKEFSIKDGKTIRLFICPKTAHIKLDFIQGGEFPPELSGLYTSEEFAERDIIKYLARKKKDLE